MMDPPTVDPLSVANHLHPGHRAALSSIEASLPRKREYFTTTVFQKIYKSSCFERDIPPYSLSSGLTREDGSSTRLRITQPSAQGGEMFNCRFKPLHVSRSSSKLWTNYGFSSCVRKIAVVEFVRTVWQRKGGVFECPHWRPKAMFGHLQKKEGKAFKVCLPRKLAEFNLGDIGIISLPIPLHYNSRERWHHSQSPVL